MAMADSANRNSNTIILPSGSLCSAEDADINRGEIGPFKTNTLGMQPVTA